MTPTPTLLPSWNQRALRPRRSRQRPDSRAREGGTVGRQRSIANVTHLRDPWSRNTVCQVRVPLPGPQRVADVRIGGVSVGKVRGASPPSEPHTLAPLTTDSGNGERFESPRELLQWYAAQHEAAHGRSTVPFADR